MWQCTPLIPSFGRQKLADIYKFEVYIVRPYLKGKKEKNETEINYLYFSSVRITGVRHRIQVKLGKLLLNIT